MNIGVVFNKKKYYKLKIFYYYFKLFFNVLYI